MSQPILYSFRRCPYAMRVRMALLYTQQQVELREVVLRDKPKQLIEASAKGTVPVMVLAKGEVLEESLDIIDWALSKKPGSGLHYGQLERDLVIRCEHEFKGHLDRFKYATRYEDVNLKDERSAASQYLLELETKLLRSDYLFSDRIGFADITIAPFVRQFANTDRIWFELQPWAALIKWLKRFEESRGFKAIMLKYPQWQPENRVTFFPETNQRSYNYIS